ncbi:hypothetical protein FBUS_11091 [Fasciolopsis buskii]|uniref:RGS domain-containing protein n=1 Tax=Fasciolopsis buskii TaxID=27845 RepID=A0A8E0VIT3_9TREM|nr:hypothetical protein FBUS_11091 [Fasciolopsis buski]
MSATLKASKAEEFGGFDSSLVEKCNAFTPSPLEIAVPRAAGILGILGDSEGVKLFNRFLCMHSAGHLLDFWFACKGFRTNVDPSNPDKLFQVAKVIYRTYVKSGADYAVPLPPSLKHEIMERMSSYHKGYKNSTSIHLASSPGIDRTLFDSAQDNVGSILENSFYPDFLEYLRRSSVCGNHTINRLLTVGLEKGVEETFSSKVLQAGSPMSKARGRKSTRNQSEELAAE